VVCSLLLIQKIVDLAFIIPEASGDLQARLKACEIELEREIKQRELTEQCFEDVKRECKNPSVVPALLKAFAEIACSNDVDMPLAKVDR
jgi:hypothetical protein